MMKVIEFNIFQHKSKPLEEAVNRNTEALMRASSNYRWIPIGIATLSFFIAIASYMTALEAKRIQENQFNYQKWIEWQKNFILITNVQLEFKHNFDLYERIATEKEYLEGKMGSQQQRFSDRAYAQAIANGQFADKRFQLNLMSAYNVFEVSNNLFEKMNFIDVIYEITQPEHAIKRRIEMYDTHKKNYDSNIERFKKTQNSLAEYLNKIRDGEPKLSV